MKPLPWPTSSVLSIVLAMQLGFSAVLIIGAITYGIGAMAYHHYHGRITVRLTARRFKAAHYCDTIFVCGLLKILGPEGVKPKFVRDFLRDPDDLDDLLEAFDTAALEFTNDPDKTRGKPSVHGERHSDAVDASAGE